MKLQPFNFWRAALPVITLMAFSACAQDSLDSCACATMKESRMFFEASLKNPDNPKTTPSIRLDNETRPDKKGRDANFYCNPLVLNGKQLDYSRFSIMSKGKLTVVEGNPELPEATQIPFVIYLRRNGEIITQGKSDPGRKVFEIEISEVLALAKPDDHLLIVPVRETDWKAKRIIKVIDGC